MAANSKAVQVRIKVATASQVKGQRAHDLRIGSQPAYVDVSRSMLNRELVKPLTGPELRKICTNLRAKRQTKRAMKSNAAIGVSGIITFGHEAQKIFMALPAYRQDAAYLGVAEAVASRLGTSVSGLVVHADEASPHAHFQLPGYTSAGVPVSQVAKREALRDIQTVAAEIMARNAPGIQRGKSRKQRIEEGEDYADTVWKNAHAMRTRLPADMERAKNELAAVNEQLNTNVTRLQKAEDDLAQLIAKNVNRRAKLTP